MEIKQKYYATAVATLKEEYRPLQTAATVYIDAKQYSTLKKLLAATIYMNRSVHNFSCKKGDRVIGPICADEMQGALTQWLQCIQQTHYADELKLLRPGKEVKKTSPILKLTPIYDEESKLMKMGGRIEFANLSEEE